MSLYQRILSVIATAIKSGWPRSYATFATANELAIWQTPAARTSGLQSVRPYISASFGRFDAMALKRMDNVGIVIDDLGGTIDFFRELGLELEGWATIEGEWAGRVTGLADQCGEIAMMRTPDGHSRLELSRFLTPPVVADHRNAPVNALGYLRVMFAVEDIVETLAGFAISALSS
jgi:catechol 2,3-dioxygenase-like lactoylglutathione lyase family enzyme